MERLGFDNKWISLISCCIRTVSFSMLVNGEPRGLIHPSRGLCQGNPLSPYLFLLCAEGLHALIQQAKNSGKLHGVSLCREGPKVSHLFFADDSLLFCQANDNDCQTVLDILDTYEQALGQQINRGKIQLFFSTNTEQHIRNKISGLLGVPTASEYEKYVGLPSFVGRAKKKSFARGVIGLVRLVFLVLANRNQNFRFVKFPTETDRNNWKPIGFGCISVSVDFSRFSVLVNITDSQSQKEKNNLTSHGVIDFSIKITTQNHNHRFTENSIDSVLNKTQNIEKR